MVDANSATNDGPGMKRALVRALPWILGGVPFMVVNKIPTTSAGSDSTSYPEALPPGERLTVHVDPDHLVAPIATYRPTAFSGILDYVGMAFVLLYPLLMLCLGAYIGPRLRHRRAS